MRSITALGSLLLLAIACSKPSHPGDDNGPKSAPDLPPISRNETFLPYVKTRADIEASVARAKELGAPDPGIPVYPLTEDLVVTVGADRPEHVASVTRADLNRLNVGFMELMMEAGKNLSAQPQSQSPTTKPGPVLGSFCLAHQDEYTASRIIVNAVREALTAACGGGDIVFTAPARRELCAAPLAQAKALHVWSSQEVAIADHPLLPDLMRVDSKGFTHVDP